jgi:hypothetical protein
MIRDPFYCQIIERLNRTLDPELFEQCASDLLRAVYPALVPIRGGSDGGMDGAIADLDGPPLPLVTTTSDRVSRNLTRSLQRYVSEGGQRRHAVVATSRPLTAKQRRKLEAEAEKLGFELRQIHDQAAMADLLYRDSKWCRELLNLTGELPPLSCCPVTDRPQVAASLVGRDAELEWLLEKRGDLLILGQPGSGKTALFHSLAKCGKGRFAVVDDPAAIISAVRDQSPDAIFVDDAHLRCDLIRRLRQARQDVGVAFRIVANCWPGAREEVAHVMNVCDESIRTLRLLPQDEMVQVIKAAGIHGPDPLVQEIVEQAAGRPGLAITLCQICQRGAVREIALADALARDMRVAFDRLVGADAATILAAFSIGGDGGMRMQDVAECLELSPTELRGKVARLAAGGVLWEVDNTRLEVRPPSLRDALVRDTFFSGPASLSPDRLIARTPKPADTAITLFRAKSRGGEVPWPLMTDALERAEGCRWSDTYRCNQAWETFAYLGKRETEWVLARHPEKLFVIADAALSNAPEISIPMFLDAMVDPGRDSLSQSQDPFPVLESWVKSGEPRTGEDLARREALLTATLIWFQRVGEMAPALRAVSAAMSPKFEKTEPIPGSGRQFRLRFGCVSSGTLTAIQQFWPRVLESLLTNTVLDWAPVQALVTKWAHPGTVRAPSEDIARAMRAFAGTMLQDMARLASGRPGLLHWIKSNAIAIGAWLEVDLDREFEILFPIERPATWHTTSEEQLAAARNLGRSWARGRASEIVRRVIRFEREAKEADLRCPHLTYVALQEAAEHAKDLLSWILALAESDAPSDLIGRFLRKAADLKLPQLPGILSFCLSQPTQQTAALDVVLTRLDADETNVALAFEILEKHTEWVRSRAFTNAIPEKYLLAMLKHGSNDVRCAAAIGEWESDPKGQIRDAFRAEWRSAVVQCVEAEYWLPKAFEADRTLAFDWLMARICERFGCLGLRATGVVESAISALTTDEKRLVLERLQPDYLLLDFVDLLIGEDTALYVHFLRNESFKRLHLALLGGEPRNVFTDEPNRKPWVDRAVSTLDAGYSEQEVVDATIGNVWPLSSEAWRGWIRRYEPFRNHPDARIRRVASRIVEFAQGQMERGLREEEEAAVHGKRR